MQAVLARPWRFAAPGAGRRRRRARALPTRPPRLLCSAKARRPPPWPSDAHERSEQDRVARAPRALADRVGAAVICDHRSGAGVGFAKRSRVLLCRRTPAQYPRRAHRSRLEQADASAEYLDWTVWILAAPPVRPRTDMDRWLCPRSSPRPDRAAAQRLAGASITSSAGGGHDLRFSSAGRRALVQASLLAEGAGQVPAGLDARPRSVQDDGCSAASTRSRSQHSRLRSIACARARAVCSRRVCRLGWPGSSLTLPQQAQPSTATAGDGGGRHRLDAGHQRSARRFLHQRGTWCRLPVAILGDGDLLMGSQALDRGGRASARAFIVNNNRAFRQRRRAPGNASRWQRGRPVGKPRDRHADRRSGSDRPAGAREGAWSRLVPDSRRAGPARAPALEQAPREPPEPARRCRSTLQSACRADAVADSPPAVPYRAIRRPVGPRDAPWRH